mgnify:CR=1 FL=1
MTASTTTFSQPIEPVQANRSNVNPWILNPVLDTVFGFGGLVWIFFFFHYFFLKGEGSETLLSVSAVGGLVFAESHTVSTLLTVYRTRDTRRRFKTYTFGLATAGLALILLGLVIPGSAPIYIKIYLLLVPHHFMNQCYGIALLYCMKRSCKLGPLEKISIQFFTQSVAWYAIFKQLTYRQWSGNSLLNVEIPFWGPLPEVFCDTSEKVLLVSVLTLAGVVVFRSLGKSSDQNDNSAPIPIPAQLTLLTGALAFTMGPAATGIYWLYVSAFFHGTQYLMIAAAKYARESNKDGVEQSTPGASILLKGPALKFLALSFFLSLLFYHGIPGLVDNLGFTVLQTGAIIFAILSTFHIITDSAIWKLGDRKTREILLS